MKLNCRHSRLTCLVWPALIGSVCLLLLHQQILPACGSISHLSELARVKRLAKHESIADDGDDSPSSSMALAFAASGAGAIELKSPSLIGVEMRAAPDEPEGFESRPTRSRAGSTATSSSPVEGSEQRDKLKSPARVYQDRDGSRAQRPLEGKPRKPDYSWRQAERARPEARYEDADRDEDDCYDGDRAPAERRADYRHFFSNPIRQLERIMDRVFDQIPVPGLYDDEEQYADTRQFPSADYGASSAASYRGGADGYLRSSSLVSNNGRTRGLVTETRNGRTRTRRIGDDDDQYSNT